jgi:hypothetical protein
MTRETFDTWLKDTWLVSTSDNVWQVSVKSAYAKDWLENRLHDTILRTASAESGIPAGQLTLQFIVVDAIDDPPDNLNGATPSLNGRTSGAIKSTDVWQPDSPSLYRQFTAPIKTINTKTGYYPLPRFYIEFWETYLVIRWKQAGRRAWSLRQKLLSRDTRKVTGKNFTSWTPIIETSFDALAQLISTNRAVITGRRGQCQQYEQDRDRGQPRGDDCCGRHTAAGCRIEMAQRGRSQKHCYFWRVGVLEVLSQEKMIVVDEVGKNRHHLLRLQVYHSLPPVLTPFQVSFLPKSLRDKHHDWLQQHGDKMDWRVADWQAVPADLETFIDYDPDWNGEDRQLDGRYQPNPYLGEQAYHDTCHDRPREEALS